MSPGLKRFLPPSPKPRQFRPLGKLAASRSLPTPVANALRAKIRVYNVIGKNIRFEHNLELALRTGKISKLAKDTLVDELKKTRRSLHSSRVLQQRILKLSGESAQAELKERRPYPTMTLKQYKKYLAQTIKHDKEVSSAIFVFLEERIRKRAKLPDLRA